MKFTDNYRVNNAIIDFMEEQSIPDLDVSVYLDLAPEFDDYQSPYFIYHTRFDSNDFNLNVEFDDIKSDFETIVRAENSNLKVSDEQLKSEALKVLESFKKDCREELDSLSFNWVFDISDNMNLVRLMSYDPEEDLTWSSSAVEDFSEYIEDELSEDKKSEILALEEDVDVSEHLDLYGLWKSFKPQSRWYLYSWERDPKTALNEIIDVINSYRNKLDSDTIALEIYDRMSN